MIMPFSLRRVLLVGVLLFCSAIASAQSPSAHLVASFKKFDISKQVRFENEDQASQVVLGLKKPFGLRLLNRTTDELGFLHYRFIQTFAGIDVVNTMYLLHTKNGKIESANGEAVNATATFADDVATLTAKRAVDVALMANHLVENNANALAPQLVFVGLNGNLDSGKLLLAWKVDVRSNKPLIHKSVYVDAHSAKVVYEQEKIQSIGVQGTAHTKYSGVRTIITDSLAIAQYNLNDPTRGGGVHTWNLNNGTNPSSRVEFTDADNIWQNAPNNDDYALDAHWAAEITYDYYLAKFNRNSLDDAGFPLNLNVHYDNNYFNAFWDGTDANFGDGSNGATALTALDIVGHEFTHGVTEKTSGLNYAYESGALNESFSDIFGTLIEFYGKPATANWDVGEDIGQTLRSMANPKQYGNPDTYLGQLWAVGPADNGGVHTNSGVQNKWFYLLVQGDSGVNDKGDAYNVSGIGLTDAGKIAYRTNCFYLTQGAQYATARFYSILSAIDLFGACSPQVEAVTNAWFAVGVGQPFFNGALAVINAKQNVYCQAPAFVQFTNASSNAITATWDFGDGSPTSNALAPSHLYTQPGNYTVTLMIDGGACGKDTAVAVNYISISSLNPCTVNLDPFSNIPVQTACFGKLYDDGGPDSNYTSGAVGGVTISPTGAANVVLTFNSFSYENSYDYLNIYDGPSNQSPLIGSYTGNSLPNGGTITSSGPSITLAQNTDAAVEQSGFELTWQCNQINAAPVVNFFANPRSSCVGSVTFTDLSLNFPTSRTWFFGDGQSDTGKTVSHAYATTGQYDVTLIVSNANGSDSLTKLQYINISRDVNTATASVDSLSCLPQTATITASDSVTWFNAAVAVQAVGSGNTFNTPLLSQATTFFYEQRKPVIKKRVGPQDNLIGNGSIFTNPTDRYLVFNTYKPFTLDSVRVYAQGDNNRTIELRDSAGNVIQSATVYVKDGESMVPLNFKVPIGKTQQLGLLGSGFLYRNNSGANYPYVLPGIVTITGSNAGIGGFYYFFYDWHISLQPCYSERLPITVPVSSSITASHYTYVKNKNEVSFTNLSVNATGFTWDFGDGSTSTQTNPVHVYAQAGRYAVKLHVESINCIADFVDTIVISQSDLPHTASAYTGLSLYPNPTFGAFSLKFGTEFVNVLTTVDLYDARGRQLGSKQITPTLAGETVSLTLDGVAKGIYLMVVRNTNMHSTFKVEKQ